MTFAPRRTIFTDYDELNDFINIPHDPNNSLFFYPIMNLSKITSPEILLEKILVDRHGAGAGYCPVIDKVKLSELLYEIIIQLP